MSSMRCSASFVRSPGTTVLVYDQTCAAEKRRRRKRGTYPDPDRRVFINEAVCEGCGDCGVASNCVAIVPRETPLGRKRAIDQSACNKDYACVEGFCPSFVSVYGGQLRRRAVAGAAVETGFEDLPEPSAPRTRRRLRRGRHRGRRYGGRDRGRPARNGRAPGGKRDAGSST